METIILKEKRKKTYLKADISTNKSPINTIVPNFYYKNKKGEIVVPKIKVYL